MEYQERLAIEAEFSDREYQDAIQNLNLNDYMFSLYKPPYRLWQPRSYAASLFGDLAGKKILDYGCGIGEESLYFALLGAAEVQAVDISQVGVDVTNRRAAHHGMSNRIHASIQDALNMKFPDATFDMVHGLGILHHLDLEPSFNELARVMKPGARAIFIEHIGNFDFIQDQLKGFLRWDKHATETERPLKNKDIRRLSSRYFDEVRIKEFTLLGRLRRVIRPLGSTLVEKIDDRILSLVPPLRPLGAKGVVYLKRSNRR